MIDEPLAFLAEAFGGELAPALEFELYPFGGTASSDSARLNTTLAGPVGPVEVMTMATQGP